MIKGIDVVFIHVKNPEKMAKWYKENLGFEISYRTSDHTWQEFRMPNSPQTRFALDYSDSNPTEVEQQSIMISFKVDNIQLAISELEKKGIVFWGKNKVIDVGPTLIATFKDPEGNFVQISQKKE
ncbi:MAG: VOC family protein [Candidatus Heimdallarchaeota archaeon]|nr:VOC family protein [Candidatus Heimdallarchaeota archaeon]